MDHRHDSAFGEILSRLFLLFIGLIVLIPAVHKLHVYYSLYIFGTRTSGTVSHPFSGRDWGGRPLVQYEDGDGNIHEFKSRAKTHWFKQPVKGESIELFFDKEDPRKAIVNNFFYYVFLPILFVLAGGCCCLKSIWFHSSKWKKP